jgi:hypothetical protein
MFLKVSDDDFIYKYKGSYNCYMASVNAGMLFG